MARGMYKGLVTRSNFGKPGSDGQPIEDKSGKSRLEMRQNDFDSVKGMRTEFHKPGSNKK